MQKVSDEHVVRTFDKNHPPVASVEPGEVFIMQTNDRFKDWTNGEEWPMAQLSVMTGPVRVAGTRPGHMMAINVLDIQPRFGFGYVVAIPGYGLLKEKIHFCKKVVPIEGNRIRYSDTISLRYRPNISKIGLAPAGEARKSNAVGPFGGQLSNSQLGPGCTVFLPVSVEGGLLTLEDVHARMGDGEATASAVEIAADVTLKCDIVDEAPLDRPFVLTKDEVLTMGDGENVEQAAQQAVQDLALLLERRNNVSSTEAAMLASVAADLRISEMAGSPCHVRAAIDRSVVGM